MHRYQDSFFEYTILERYLDIAVDQYSEHLEGASLEDEMLY